jgi:hypothetical protein
MAFDVYAVTGGEHQLVGRTPSEEPLTIPPCQWWYVEPRRSVDMEKVGREVEAQGVIPQEVQKCQDGWEE